jgi:hypothetical protein
MLCVKALFTLPCDEHDTPNQGTSGAPRLCPAFMTLMDEDFIERTLRERRSLPDALTDMLAKYNRIPSGNERSMLERMIEILKDEIALRQNGVRAAK